ncbi:hypothetical protein JAAARDRAFT_205756 [Jaapia argillacea MUCL 33604]|uniref:DUF6697 domain-containing protein n=1 Tax=Jaapia argillacea MUCL 33604 TaxID=933084 RepID=A0A067Q0X7_9AGAM|nr:hypothetical protein JAAARDRAFT_205756 [Jaapia argillacea MUCL 33604]
MLPQTSGSSQVTKASPQVQYTDFRVNEALGARDAVVIRLKNAYVSIRQKSAQIDHLQEKVRALGKKETKHSGKSGALLDDFSSNFHVEGKVVNGEDGEIERLKSVVQELKAEIELIKGIGSQRAADDPPCYDSLKGNRFHQDYFPPTSGSQSPTRSSLDSLSSLMKSLNLSPNTNIELQKSLANEAFNIEQNAISPTGIPDPIAARHAVISALPLPNDIPDDALKPIVVPPTLTLHEFLNQVSSLGLFKNSLSQYRVFHELTTSWCPEREEHGYFLAPSFKCNTNPRVATAHCWKSIDPLAKMNKPTECFYHKDGKLYYAGVYKPIRLDDLTTTEWENLSNETVQVLVKETLAGRKNSSPANLYEIGQLYSAGALKIACVGVQCIGFNHALYRIILDQASKSVEGQTGVSVSKWKSPQVGGGVPLSPGVVWNSRVNAVVGGDVVPQVGDSEDDLCGVV